MHAHRHVVSEKGISILFFYLLIAQRGPFLERIRHVFLRQTITEDDSKVNCMHSHYKRYATTVELERADVNNYRSNKLRCICILLNESFNCAPCIVVCYVCIRLILVSTTGYMRRCIGMTPTETKVETELDARRFRFGILSNRFMANQTSSFWILSAILPLMETGNHIVWLYLDPEIPHLITYKDIYGQIWLWRCHSFHVFIYAGKITMPFALKLIPSRSLLVSAL